MPAAAPGSSHAPETILPPHDPTGVEAISEFLAKYTGNARLVAPDGMTSAYLPDEVHRVLLDVVKAMSAGRAITVAPVSQRLTTSDAAEIIGVSRPTLVKLLDDGEIPYDQPRKHRVLRLDDVLAYRDRKGAERRALLAEMTRQAAADGLYDTSADDYQDALDEARHEKGDDD